MEIPDGFLVVIETVKVSRLHLVRAEDGDTAIGHVENCTIGSWALIPGSEQDLEGIEYESRELKVRERKDNISFLRAFREIMDDNEPEETPPPKPKRKRKTKTTRDKEVENLAKVAQTRKKKE